MEHAGHCTLQRTAHSVGGEHLGSALPAKGRADTWREQEHAKAALLGQRLPAEATSACGGPQAHHDCCFPLRAQSPTQRRAFSQRSPPRGLPASRSDFRRNKAVLLPAVTAAETFRSHWHDGFKTRKSHRARRAIFSLSSLTRKSSGDCAHVAAARSPLHTPTPPPTPAPPHHTSKSSSARALPVTDPCWLIPTQPRLPAATSGAAAQDHGPREAQLALEVDQTQCGAGISSPCSPPSAWSIARGPPAASRHTNRERALRNKRPRPIRTCLLRVKASMPARAERATWNC